MLFQKNKFILKLFILISIFLNFGCKSKAIKPINNKDIYEVVYNNQFSTIKEKQHKIITNYEDFNTLISDLKLEEKDYEALLKIDLEKNNLLILFCGEKSSGGYDVYIDKVIYKTTEIEVFPKYKKPKKNEKVINLVTSPYVFVTFFKGREIKVLE